MQRLVFINGLGSEIDLTSGNFGITNWEGFANTGLNVQMQQVPFEDGGVMLDALLESRELSVTVAIQDNNDLELRYELKRRLISALNPKLGEGVLVYTNDYLSKQIKAVPQIPIFENKNSNDAGTLKASVSFTCPSPYWEDVEETIVAFGLQEQPVIRNEGDVPCQLKAEFITEDVTNPEVINLTTDKKIKYNGELKSTLYIDTNAGNKTTYLGKMKLKLEKFGYSIKAICYNENENLFVAVCSNGYAIKSNDGDNWEYIPQFTTRNLSDIKYINHTYICVGEYGVIYTSQGLKTWALRTSGTEYSLSRIAYSEELSLYIIVGSHGVILTSSDLSTWTQQTSGTSNNLKSVKYVDFLHKFIVVGRNKTLISSADGITWTPQTLVGSNTYQIYDLAFNNSVVVAVTSNIDVGGSVKNAIYSEDGVHWYTTHSYISEATFIEFVSEYNMFMTNKNSGTTDGRYFINMIPDLTTAYSMYVYNKNLDSFVCIGNNIIVKIYGLNSFVEYTDEINYGLSDICYSKKLDLFVMVTGNGKVLTSKDKKNWVERYSRNNAVFYSVVYSEDLGLFAAGGNYRIYSEDGITWTEATTSTTGVIRKIIYSSREQKFVAVYNALTYNAIIRYSSDGINWNDATVQSLYDFVDICYSSHLRRFVAINEQGGIYSSTNGSNWTSHTIVSNDSYNSVCYSDVLRKFIAVGVHNVNGVKNTVLKTSIDGQIWKDETPIIENGYIISKMIYNPLAEVFTGYFLDNDSVGQKTFTSVDLQKFTTYDSPVLIRFLKDGYIGIGSYGVIVLSESERETNVINNIDNTSDMNLNLQLGDNRFRIKIDSGNMVCQISYRQKYLGV